MGALTVREVVHPAQKDIYLKINLPNELPRLKREASYALIALQALLAIQAGLGTVAFFLTVTFGMYELGTVMIAASLKLSVSTLFLCFFLYDAERRVEKEEEKFFDLKLRLKRYMKCVEFLNHWKTHDNHRFNLEGLLLYPFERLELLELLVEELEKPEPSYEKALSVLFSLERYLLKN